MKTTLKALSLVVAAAFTVSVSHAQSITNGGFEGNGLSFTGYPGYVNQAGNPSTITGWTASDVNVGVNGRGTGQQTAFLTQAPITQSESVAFLQRQGSPNSLSQTITGLTTNSTYWITYREAARQNNSSVASSAVFGGTTIVADHALTTNAPFKLQIGSAYNATGTSASLSLNNTSASGDQTLLLDDVRLYYVTPGATPVGMNSSFETNTVSANFFQQGSQPGGVPTALWGFTAGAGIVANSSPYGNPAAPNGTSAAMLQNIGTFSDVYGTFEAGVQYQLTLNVASRELVGNPFSVTLGGASILFGGNSTYTPQSQGSYMTLTSDFFTVSSAGPKELMFSGLNASGDKTTFIDNIAIIPEPSTWALLAFSLTAVMVLRRRRSS